MGSLLERGRCNKGGVGRREARRVWSLDAALGMSNRRAMVMNSNVAILLFAVMIALDGLPLVTAATDSTDGSCSRSSLCLSLLLSPAAAYHCEAYFFFVSPNDGIVICFFSSSSFSDSSASLFTFSFLLFACSLSCFSYLPFSLFSFSI